MNNILKDRIIGVSWVFAGIFLLCALLIPIIVMEKQKSYNRAIVRDLNSYVYLCEDTEIECITEWKKLKLNAGLDEWHINYAIYYFKK